MELDLEQISIRTKIIFFDSRFLKWNTIFAQLIETLDFDHQPAILMPTITFGFKLGTITSNNETNTTFELYVQSSNFQLISLKS